MFKVFLVDTGSMLAFDKDMSFETVAQLKEMIARKHNIPVENQVLMVSGGESLDPTLPVYTYYTRTNSTPIFLFSTIESANPPCPSYDLGSDGDLGVKLEAALSLPPLYETIVARCHLVHQFHEFAKAEAQACERLVHEQHLQQQGWAVVIANLEDITSAFKTKVEMFQNNFESFLAERERYEEVLNQFASDLELLGRIPVLEPLLRGNNDRIESDETGRHSVSLQQWISSKDNQNTLEIAAIQCRTCLEQFSFDKYNFLQAEITGILASVEHPTMTEIKGLEDRLYGLDKMMSEASMIVAEQDETAQAFEQNKKRAANVGDVSVLPDLCASHRDQLKVMLTKHKQLRDIHRRCLQAKIELAKHLHIRLKWIVYIENKLMETDSTIVIYHENLKRLKRYLEILQQIHMAPSIYLRSVIEVIRRRAFAKEFLKWSKALSHQADDLYRKEIAMREEFTSLVGNHFLYSFFNGMRDSPPPYAVEAPEEFDNNLPDIQPADVEMLRALLPDVNSLLSGPEVDVTPNFAVVLPNFTSFPSSHGIKQDPIETHPEFVVFSGSNVEPLSGRDCYLSALTNVQSVTAAAHPGQEKVPKIEQALGDLLLESPRDERDPEESEPDTEEFEKVDGGVAVNDAGEAREVSGIRASGSVQSVSNAALPLPLPTAPADGPSLPYPAPLSPNDGGRILASDDSYAACSSLQDFITADFYIDESMPSSYTESNGTTGMGWGGARGQATKGHHVIVAELQHKLEEKSAAIAQLQEETSQSRQRFLDLENQLRHVQQMENEAVHTLRNDVNAARQSVLQTRDEFVSYLVTLSAQLTDVIGLVQHQVDSDRDNLVRETLCKAQSEYQVAVANVSRQLEIESVKLNDAHKEIQSGQELLQKRDELLEKVRQEAENQLELQKQQIQAEHHETVKKMTLEHELELESLREEHRKECNRLESGLRESQEDLSNKLEQLVALKHAQSFEAEMFSKRLQEEMNKLTGKLQEEFLLKEQSSIAKSITETKQVYEEEIKCLRHSNKELSDSCARKEEQLSCLAKEFETKTDQQLKEMRESLSKEHRQEVEGLRARFRLAFNAAGMERSPSDSSLEKIERPDSADPSRIEQQVSMLKTELEEKDAIIVGMQQKHQKEIDDLVQQCKKARSDSLRYMRTSLTAEKQVVFNEAVNKATAEKEAVIQDLKQQLKALREELQDERLLNSRIKSKEESFTFSLGSERSESSPVLSRPDSGNFHMVSPVIPRRSESSCLLGPSAISPVLEQSPETETGPTSLEIAESSGLGASVFVSPASEQTLESEAMDGSLTASAAAEENIPEKVSVYSCNVGDLVILLYDERRENYIVFTASSTYHFLHHDCFELLSLSQTGEKTNWLLAHITSKEYCQARKEQNRFRVPLGTRFYRVRAKPVPQVTLRRSQSSSYKKRLSSQSGGGSL